MKDLRGTGDGSQNPFLYRETILFGQLHSLGGLLGLKFDVLA